MEVSDESIEKMVKGISESQLFPDTMFAPQGWVCPKCGRVYSPFTPMCLYCGDEGNVTVSTTSTGYVKKRGDEVSE